MIRIAFALAAVTLALPARADALLDRLRADAARVTPESFGWTRTVRSEQRGEDGEKASRVIVERWDPAQALPKRWTLVSIDGKPPAADALKDYAKSRDTAIVSSYGRVAGYLAGKVERLADVGGKPVYRFSGLKKGTVRFGGADLSAKIVGEATVEPGAAPYVSQVRMRIAEPMRIMLVAKIERFETTMNFRPGPNGRPVPVDSNSRTGGSMMGSDGTMTTAVAFSDVRAR